MEHQDTNQIPVSYQKKTDSGNSEKRGSLNGVTQFDVSTLQIKEALQLQLDVQRRINEQLEIQRHLQLRIEEQGRKLKELFDQQQKAYKNHLKSRNLDITPEADPTFSPETVEISENSHFISSDKFQ